MRFGKDYTKFKDEVTSGGGNYIRAFKEGDTSLQFLAEPDEWVGYYEHYNPNPGGFSFPCTSEEDCPGCNSDMEKMKSRGAKVAIPTLVDDKWVNVYKVPKKFAEKLAKRGDRFGTMLDREYLITRIGTDTTTDYDVDTGDKNLIDPSKYDVPDIESMLLDNWNQVWGTDEDEKPKKKAKKEKVVADPKVRSQPKSAKEEPEYSEEELRALKPKALKKILLSEENVTLPDELEDASSDEIVDWMIKVMA